MPPALAAVKPLNRTALGALLALTVAALRETSVIFAALISTLLLHERPDRQRWIGSLLVFSGAVTLKLA